MWQRLLLVMVWFGVLANAAPPAGKNKVLVVLSSEDKLTLKDGKTHATGFYMNELLVPLKQVLDAGYVPVFANPKGNAAIMDVGSDKASHFKDAATYKQMKFLLSTLDGLKTPSTFSAVLEGGLDDYQGVLVPGGHAPMEDLTNNAELGKILTNFHEAGKPTALICHGPVALLSATTGASWPYSGYKMTVFSTPEEKDAEKTNLKGKVKFYPEDGLRKAGGTVQNGPKWKSNVVIDRELITGQNPASDAELGKKFVEQLEGRTPKS